MDFYIFIFMRKYGDNGTVNNIYYDILTHHWHIYNIKWDSCLKTTSGI